VLNLVSPCTSSTSPLTITATTPASAQLGLQHHQQQQQPQPHQAAHQDCRTIRAANQLRAAAHISC
jgi:hypothetical protein